MDNIGCGISSPLIYQKKFASPEKKKVRQGNFIAVVMGVVIGFVNGLFGAGGGMLVVPVLASVLGLGQKKAHATAILIILPLCLVSGIVYATKGGARVDVFVPTSIGVMFGGILGAFALKKCGNVMLQFLFYGVMLVAGIKMLF